VTIYLQVGEPTRLTTGESGSRWAGSKINPY